MNLQVKLVGALSLALELLLLDLRLALALSIDDALSHGVLDIDHALVREQVPNLTVAHGDLAIEIFDSGFCCVDVDNGHVVLLSEVHRLQAQLFGQILVGELALPDVDLPAGFLGDLVLGLDRVDELLLGVLHVLVRLVALSSEVPCLLQHTVRLSVIGSIILKFSVRFFLLLKLGRPSMLLAEGRGL